MCGAQGHLSCCNNGGASTLHQGCSEFDKHQPSGYLRVQGNILNDCQLFFNVYKQCSAIFFPIMQSCQNEESQMYKSQLGSHHGRWIKVQSRCMCSLRHAFTLHCVWHPPATLRASPACFRPNELSKRAKKLNSTSRFSNPYCMTILRLFRSSLLHALKMKSS